MNNKIKKLIPESLKKILKPVYRKLTVEIDKEALGDLQNYFNLDRKHAVRFLESGGDLDAAYWFCLNPKTEQEVLDFYARSPFCIFNHVYWHGSKYQKNLREKISKIARSRILDYGGGTGYLCLKLARLGMEVDYADVYGRTFEFAKWLFSKKGANVKMLDVLKDGITGRYDTILCIDVIEHVNDPQSLLKMFSEHLNPGGELFITALHPDVSEYAPMHFEIKFDPEEYLKSLGMENKEEFLWVKK